MEIGGEGERKKDEAIIQVCGVTIRAFASCSSRYLNFQKRCDLESTSDWATQVTTKVTKIKDWVPRGEVLPEPSRHGVSGLQARLVRFWGLYYHAVSISGSNHPTRQSGESILCVDGGFGYWNPEF
jgi:hypothetical protein